MRVLVRAPRIVQLLVPFFPAFVEGFDDLRVRRSIRSAMLIHVPEGVLHAGLRDVVTVAQLADGASGPTRLYCGDRDDPVEPIGHGAAFGFQRRPLPFDHRGQGCSHRYLLSEFRRYVGVRPKTLARVLRCQSAIRLLDSGDSLAEVAVRCGYADQAHLNLDFRRITGLSPDGWRRAGQAPPPWL